MYRRIKTWFLNLGEGLSRRELLVLYLGFVALTVTVHTLIVHRMMAVFEGTELTLAQSLQVVVQTMTTTGFGGYAPFSSTAVNLLMPLIMLTGIFLIFLTLPLFIGPWLEEVVKERPPTTVNSLSDHIVICGSASAHDAFITECETRGLPYVLIEPDTERAMSLHKEGYSVIHGDPAASTTLHNANIEQADHLVTDVDPDTTASIILTVRKHAPETRITAIGESHVTDQLLYSGADAVLNPRKLVGRSLADKLATSINAKFDEAVQSLGDQYRVVELPITDTSPVAGSTLADSGVWDAKGATVIGAWHHGQFIPAPEPTLSLDKETELLVLGHIDQITDLWEEKLSNDGTNNIETALIAGYGRSGKSIEQELDKHGIETTIIDRTDKDGVDIVGSVEDTATFEKAGLKDQDVLVMTVGDDETAVFGIMVARQIDPGIEIIVRANEEENVSKLRQAGSDYVLSLETVTGRMAARYVLNETIPSGTRIELMRTELPDAVGSRLDLSRIRDEYNITVIAVDHEDELETDIEDNVEIGEGDEVIIAGPADELGRFREEYTTEE